MRKTAVLWLITAVALVLIGCVIFGGVMTVLKWDFSKLSTVNYETNRHEINEKFSNISVETDTAKLTFALSEDDTCRVECYEESKEKHAVTVQDGMLAIERVNEKAWYDYIGIHFGTPKIKIFLPEAQYGALLVRSSTGNVEVDKALKFESADISLSTGHVDFLAASETLNIRTSTGNIRLSDASFGKVDLSASTGKTYLNNIACKNLISKANTGDMIMENVLVSEKLSVERTTGDVKFHACDAAEIFIKTDTGDVNGTLLSDKVFIAQTDTGRVNVPRTISGGSCEISTNTGNIEITVQ